MLALLELEQKYLDTIGDIHTEIRDLDKELAMAKVYPEGTNLDLFTDEEHDKLVAQLRDIEAEATELYTKYQEKLSSVSADNTYELSHITDEFQRQYEILLKQYEVSKADLAVARARRLWSMSTRITRAELQPCDLLFRGTDSDKSHVGVYVGNGMVIESKGRDCGVVIRPIDATAGYWKYFGRLKMN